MGSYNKIDTSLRKEVYERDKLICQVCKLPVILTRNIKTQEDFKFEASLDHILPRSKGGEDTLNNLRTICRSCNSTKGANEGEEELKFLSLNKGEYTRIHNSILTALSRTKLNSEESRILFAILTKTYGFNQAEDWIANSQLEQITGIHRTHCSRTVHKLINRRIITKTGNIIKFNKYFFQWKDRDKMPKLATLPKLAIKDARTGNKELPKWATTKDTLTKDIVKNIAADSAADKVPFNSLGAEIIKAFEDVDPKNKTYYNNTTQRKACDFLLKEYGLEEILKRISVLTRTNKISYFPAINSPNDLKEKWVKLQDAVERKRGEKITKETPNYIL